MTDLNETDLREIALTDQEFLRRLPAAARTPARINRFHTDYALTRLVAANCAAIGEHADETNPTSLVIKGGFAVRHLYGSPRFSKDADLSMESDDLGIAGEGPGLIKWPRDMKHEAKTADGLAGWIIFIKYRGPDGVERDTQCDLNDHTRAIKKRPPQRRLLRGLFLPPFPVWAARTEEILGEKMFALVDSWWSSKNLRVKDAFDLRYVLLLDNEPVNAAEVQLTYNQHRVATKDRKFPSLDQYLDTLRTIAATSAAAARWRDDVVDSVPDAPALATATEELCDLLRKRVL